MFFSNHSSSYKNIFFDICQNSKKLLYKVNGNLKNLLNFNFLKNNVKESQSSLNHESWLKLFNFLKNEIDPKSILFLNDPDSSVEIEKKWTDDFKVKVYYSP